MTTQELAFRAYYAAMTNAELLRTAANKNSFIDVAQKVLGEELMKRNLTLPSGELSHALTSLRLAQGRLASIKSALLRWLRSLKL